jgi:hypothetical protein
MSNTMIAFGGCHVAGYKVGPENSFINVLAKSSGFECIHKAPQFQIKKSIEIREKINTHNPEIVILQLGNFEFQGSLKEILKKKISSKTENDTEYGINDNISQEVFKLPESRNIKKGWLLNNFINPLIWGVLLRKNRIHLRNIQQIIRENPSTHFIVLSPMPCSKISDNIIRRKAGKWYKKLFSPLSNVTYIDLFRFIAVDKRYFIDPAHLNTTGHRILGRIVSHHIKGLNLYQKNQVAIAV